MYAALNSFSCPDHGFFAISPPFFVFPRATLEKAYFLPKPVRSVRNRFANRFAGDGR